MPTKTLLTNQTIRDGLNQLSYAVDAFLTASAENGLLLGVTQGGSPTLKALRGRLPYDTGSIRANRNNGTVETEAPTVSVEGRDVVLVDDSCLTGETLAACAKRVLDAGARSVSGAVLINHKVDKVLPDCFNLVRAFDVPGSVCFGFGADLDGEFRDLDCVKGLV